MGQVKSVKTIVQNNATNSKYLVNLWAVPEWDNYPAISPFTVGYWTEQVRLSKYMANSTLFNSECGIMFPLDNYYRTLTLHCYSNAGQTPELYPSISDVNDLHQSGVTNVWGWPHFLINEFDDGYTGASTRQTQLEIRYIKKTVDIARSLGLYGLTSNCDTSPNEGLNTYAFARMCKSPNLTVTEMIDDIASLLADSATKNRLVNILRFIENKSTWHASMPPEYREADLDCGIVTSATIGLTELDYVNALTTNSVPFPDTPAGYLNRIRSRLEYIRDHP